MGGKMLRRLFGSKSFETPMDYRELDNKKFHDLHYVKNIITVKKLRHMTREVRAGRVGGIGEIYNISVEKS
jgi:hypothetical protein